ncbi:MAG TPA: hypothetical protein VIK18_13310 [Pirellulales bacterium]
MLSMLKPLVRVRDRRWLATHANALAAKLTASVTPTLSAQVLGMPKAEARGYIRAKAMPVVEAELERIVLERPALRGGVQPLFVQGLIERIIRLGLDDVAHGRVLRREQRRAA